MSLSFLLERAVIYINQDQVGLLAGMVLGQADWISPQLQHSMKVIGMQHVLVASGYNVSLVVQAGTYLVKNWASRKLTLVILTGLIWWYVCLLGLSPPLTRAACLATGQLWLTKLALKQGQPGFLLAYFGLLIAVFKIEWWDSISFQLTMAATTSLMLFARWFQHLFGGNDSSGLSELAYLTQPPPESSAPSGALEKVKTVFLESVATTLAAQVLIVPLLLHHFGQLSLASLIANPLLLWLTPILTLLGFGYFIGLWLSEGLPVWLTQLSLGVGGWVIGNVCWLFLVGVSWLAGGWGYFENLSRWSWWLVAGCWLISGLVWLKMRPQSRLAVFEPFEVVVPPSGRK